MEKQNGKPHYITLEALFNEHYRALCFFAVSFVADHDLAEDLVQEVFISFWDKRNALKGSGNEAKSYLYTAVRNKCLNHLRHQKVKTSSFEQIQSGSVKWEEDHLHQLIRAEVFNEIYRAIEKLPPQCRKIYKMTYFSRMSEKKIAEKMALSINSIKSQKQRGKALLKKYLSNLYNVFF